jgi:hypothetical protein
VLDAIADNLGITVHDPSTWDRVSTDVDQVPRWGHQSQWDIREDRSSSQERRPLDEAPVGGPA